MATRAAWLHYAGGLTQSDVAKRLGVTGLKAHRLITRANQEGLVKVYIDGDVAECIELENKISQKYSLDYCEVVPEFENEDLPLKALGIAGAQFLRRELERGENKLIGMGHGRTLGFVCRVSATLVRHFDTFCVVAGGLTRKFSANPHDVIHRLAERTGAEAYVMPVPFFANTADDRQILLSQRGIGEVFELARQSTLKMVGIGTAEHEASLVMTGMIEHSEIAEIKEAGGTGELLGHFFDAHGNTVETTLTERTMAISRADLEATRIVAVAGGKVKTHAIRAVLASGSLGGLITDERTARALVEEQPVG